MKKEAVHFFGKKSGVVHASAPGRMDVMGGVADYSGSLTLQAPIKEQTTAYVALRNDGLARMRSLAIENGSEESEVIIDFNAFSKSPRKMTFEDFREALGKNTLDSWAAYVAGCIFCLSKEIKGEISGADILIESTIPIGKGISSSAALTIATLCALSEALGIELDGNRIPLLSQQVENHVIGAPCGLMDQLAIYHGRKDHLLPILCRPDTVYSPIPIPKSLQFIGIDSDQRHSVKGASYTQVRTAAFMGYTIIARMLGASDEKIANARHRGVRRGLSYHGYLTGIKPSHFEEVFAPHLPETVTGEDFLREFGETIDPITQPQPGVTYQVRTCAAHPVYEHHRVQQFKFLIQLLNESELSSGDRQSCYEQLGELMYQSHASYSRCGLGNDRTDEIVRFARAGGDYGGIHGAKITGGGGGGVVCLLCEGRKGMMSAEAIADQFSRDYRTPKRIFKGSSEGAKWLNNVKTD